MEDLGLLCIEGINDAAEILINRKVYDHLQNNSSILLKISPKYQDKEYQSILKKESDSFIKIGGQKNDLYRIKIDITNTMKNGIILLYLEPICECN